MKMMQKNIGVNKKENVLEWCEVISLNTVPNLLDTQLVHTRLSFFVLTVSSHLFAECDLPPK